MSAFEIEVFYDEDCPLCRREVALLRRFDRRSRVRWTDITAPDFDASALGLSQARLMARIHGRLPDGRIIEGLEVFRRVYAAIGFGPLVAFTRLPGVSPALEAAYALFAKNRTRLTGRCGDGRCELPGSAG